MHACDDACKCSSVHTRKFTCMYACQQIRKHANKFARNFEHICARMHARILACIPTCLRLFLHLGAESCRIASATLTQNHCENPRRKIGSYQRLLCPEDAKMVRLIECNHRILGRYGSQSSDRSSHEPSLKIDTNHHLREPRVAVGLVVIRPPPFPSLNFSYFASAKPYDSRHD